MRNIIKKILKEEVDLRSERVKSIVKNYGLKQSIDMIVGGIDTIRQSYQDNPLEFLKQFNDLTPIEKGNKIYYIDKNRIPLFYYYHNKKNGYVYINYNRIWMFFSELIGLKTTEIKEIINNWLVETYNLTGLTPDLDYYVELFTLE